MKRLSIVASAIVFIAIAGATYAYLHRPVEPVHQNIIEDKPGPVPPTAEKILELVNAERTKAGVTPLVVDENVAKSAQLKAEDMDRDDYFGHVMPSTGRVIDAEMDALLVASCVDSGENYQATPSGTATAEAALDWWMNSPPHREAILADKYSKTGIGVVYDESRQYYIAVQHFCISR